MTTDNEQSKCKQKTRYKSGVEAKKTINLIRTKHGVSKTLRVYRCSVCFGYHITSSPRQ